MPTTSVSASQALFADLHNRGISPSKAFQAGVHVCIMGGIKNVEKIQEELESARAAANEHKNNYYVKNEMLKEKTEELQQWKMRCAYLEDILKENSIKYNTKEKNTKEEKELEKYDV